VHSPLDSARPLVFAHRGGSKIGPENTIEAFDRGLAAGADGLELDVHLSRDSTVVVHHDRLLDRTTRARGPIASRTAEELARVGVPSLRDVLVRYPDTRIIIELKVAGSALARAVVDEVRRAGVVRNVCLGSFSATALWAARSAAPEIATSACRLEVRMALYRSWISLSPGRVRYRAFQVPEMSGRTRVVSPRFVRLAHQRGLTVQVWTVDQPHDIRRLLDWGVDGIISDRPDVATEVVRDWVNRLSTIDY
jgi:glycerophosphoryl diester phosphodiesterase